jgi:hypothetical protein
LSGLMRSARVEGAGRGVPRKISNSADRESSSAAQSSPGFATIAGVEEVNSRTASGIYYRFENIADQLTGNNIVNYVYSGFYAFALTQQLEFV